MISRLFFLICIVFSFQDIYANDAWKRYPSISPDGSRICFSYQGDLWISSSLGGKAERLTNNDAYDISPNWSPDGKSIAFASDRHGNFDVYIVSLAGGIPKRISFHNANEYPSGFSADGLSVYVSMHRMDSPKNIQFPSGAMSELYAIPINGTKPKQILTTPAEDIISNKKGTVLFYHDKKGYENSLRKHHVSAVARDIWMVDMQSKKHTKLTSYAGEDRNPVLSPDDKDCYFLSERSGTFNVWKFPIDTPQNTEQITRFSTHPIRFLSISMEGILCFGYHGDIYTMDIKQGKQPQKVDIQIVNDLQNNPIVYKVMTNGATEMSLSPSGKEIAFVVRGEVFVTSVDYEITKRITNTAEQERSVSFSPDGRSLIYAGERDGSWNIYKTSLIRKEEPFFFKSTVLQEEAMISSAKEEFQPKFSPSGDEIAYLEDRVVLKVYNIASKKTRLIVDSTYNYSYSDGDQWYDWSPDGQWFLLSILDKSRWVDEVGLIDAQGKGPIKNITQSGYNDGGPRWAKNGKLFTYSSDKAGLRSHGSWGSQNDVYGTFLTQEAFDRFRMTKDEFELQKLKENAERLSPEEQRKKDSLESERNKGNIKPKASDPLTIDFNGLEDRTVRMTIHSSDLADFVLSPDGERLYYLSRFEKGYDIWVQKFRERETKLLAKLGAGGGGLEQSPDGKYLFVISDGKITQIDTTSGTQKVSPCKAEME